MEEKEVLADKEILKKAQNDQAIAASEAASMQTQMISQMKEQQDQAEQMLDSKGNQLANIKALDDAIKGLDQYVDERSGRMRPSYADGTSPNTAINRYPIEDFGDKLMTRVQLAYGNDAGRLKYLRQRPEFMAAEQLTNGDGEKVPGRFAVQKKEDGRWYLIDPVSGSIDPYQLSKEIGKDIETISKNAPSVASQLAPQEGLGKESMLSKLSHDAGELVADVADNIPMISSALVATVAQMAQSPVDVGSLGATLPLRAANLSAVAGAMWNLNTSFGKYFGTYEATPQEQFKELSWELALGSLGVQFKAEDAAFRKALKNGSVPSWFTQKLIAGKDKVKYVSQRTGELLDRLISSGSGPVASGASSRMVERGSQYVMPIMKEVTNEKDLVTGKFLNPQQITAKYLDLGFDAVVDMSTSVKAAAAAYYDDLFKPALDLADEMGDAFAPNLAAGSNDFMSTLQQFNGGRGLFDPLKKNANNFVKLKKSFSGGSQLEFALTRPENRAVFEELANNIFRVSSGTGKKVGKEAIETLINADQAIADHFDTAIQAAKASGQNTFVRELTQLAHQYRNTSKKALEDSLAVPLANWSASKSAANVKKNLSMSDFLSGKFGPGKRSAADSLGDTPEKVLSSIFDLKKKWGEVAGPLKGIREMHGKITKADRRGDAGRVGYQEFKKLIGYAEEEGASEALNDSINTLLKYNSKLRTHFDRALDIKTAMAFTRSFDGTFMRFATPIGSAKAAGGDALTAATGVSVGMLATSARASGALLSKMGEFKKHMGAAGKNAARELGGMSNIYWLPEISPVVNNLPPTNIQNANNVMTVGKAVMNMVPEGVRTNMTSGNSPALGQLFNSLRVSGALGSAEDTYENIKGFYETTTAPAKAVNELVFGE